MTEPESLAQSLHEESEALRRRMVHATRPKGPLSMDQAIALHQRMEGSPDLPRLPQITAGDVNLIRQWYNAVCDLNPGYLEPKDHELAQKLGFHVPRDVRS
ncbi:hypothetical protein [Tardiphaga sp.]|uniref:hypothetical protein n=1 Tax=Tardiphaga sp. TaxID=1926292 RepID=UPI00260B667E|nr:hypothetical protein [Tardiphaga sp.]MDB5616036.1 hypothetical protein [Tardiphaga sp.]